MAHSHIYAGVAGYFGRPHDPGAVGVFRRRADGGEWEHVLATTQVHTVFVHPEEPDLVFAGASDGVWRSTDRGASFRRAEMPDGGTQVWSFIAIDGAPERMYAGASPLGVYRSEDRGASWRRLPTPEIRPPCECPFSPRVMRMAQRPGHADEIYAALEIAGAMRTTDGGETWEDLNEGLVRLSDRPHLRSSIVQRETHAEGMLDGHAIAISPAAPDTPIIALRMGLFRARDEGRRWEDLEVGRFSPTTYARDIKVSPHDPKTLYAALSVAARQPRRRALPEHGRRRDLAAIRQGAGERNDHVGRAPPPRPRPGLHRGSIRRRGLRHRRRRRNVAGMPASRAGEGHLCRRVRLISRSRAAE